MKNVLITGCSTGIGYCTALGLKAKGYRVIATARTESDIAKLERVISNLLENAIRHTSNNGKIVLFIEEINDTQCKLIISDNGTGIKAEELSYIFDTRYRASNAIQDKNKHTGLGLAITKKLLELLKSDIKVKSTLGEGTAFSFNLRRVMPIEESK